MKATSETVLPASPEAVMQLMLSDAYLATIRDALDVVSAIEEVSREERADGLHRVVRYTAPTAGRVPSFLSRYEDRAPEHVFWEERGVWDLRAHRFTYHIVPDVPEHWHERYRNEGVLTLTPHAKGSLLRVSIEYSIKLPLFGGLIERALRQEVERILSLQGEATRDALRGS